MGEDYTKVRPPEERCPDCQDRTNDGDKWSFCVCPPKAMKIAYQFAGHLRHFRANPTLLRHLLGPNPGDVFIHTFSRLNTSSPLWHGDNGGSDTPVTQDDVDYLREHYRFVSLQIDPAQGGEAYAPAAWAKDAGRWTAAQASLLRRAHEERTGARYDVVFAVRFDLWLLEDYRVEKPALHTLYGSHWKARGLYGDAYLHGTPEAIDAQFLPPFPAEFDSQALAAGFEGEAVNTAITRARGLAFDVRAVPCGLLRPSGYVMRIV